MGIFIFEIFLFIISVDFIFKITCHAGKYMFSAFYSDFPAITIGNFFGKCQPNSASFSTIIFTKISSKNFIKIFSGNSHTVISNFEKIFLNFNFDFAFLMRISNGIFKYIPKNQKKGFMVDFCKNLFFASIFFNNF